MGVQPGYSISALLNLASQPIIMSMTVTDTIKELVLFCKPGATKETKLTYALEDIIEEEILCVVLFEGLNQGERWWYKLVLLSKKLNQEEY